MDRVDGFHDFLAGLNRFDNSDIEVNMDTHVPYMILQMQFTAYIADMHTGITSVGGNAHDSGCDALQHLRRVLDTVYSAPDIHGSTIPVSAFTVLFCGCAFGFIQSQLAGRVCMRHAEEWGLSERDGDTLLDRWIDKDYGHLVKERLSAHKKIVKLHDKFQHADEQYNQNNNIEKLLDDINIFGKDMTP